MKFFCGQCEEEYFPGDFPEGFSGLAAQGYCVDCLVAILGTVFGAAKDVPQPGDADYPEYLEHREWEAMNNQPDREGGE